MQQNVLVTGGAGYIGSHVCKALSEAGFIPVTVDDLSTGHPAAVRWGPLEEANLRDRDAVARILKTHDPVGVMHLAGKAYIAESLRNPLDYYGTNVDGAISLLGAIVAHQPVPVVFSSSCTVYGDGAVAGKDNA